MKVLLIILVLLLRVTGTFAQDWNESTAELVGGPCEGCEAIFEYGNMVLNNVDTLPDFNKGQQIKVEGTIYLSDGMTPADGVILYVYQTDAHVI